MSFEQATIKVEKEAEFAELKAAIVRAFDPSVVERYLRKLRSEGLRVRDLEGVLARGVLDRDEVLARGGKKSQTLYQTLTVSDQAQMREFYLSRVEELAPGMRAKFQKLYQYY